MAIEYIDIKLENLITDSILNKMSNEGWILDSVRAENNIYVYSWQRQL